MASICSKITSSLKNLTVLHNSMTRIPAAAFITGPQIFQRALKHDHVIARPNKPQDSEVNDLYENPELNVIPEREEYESVWLHVKGYDFVTVESYLSFLHLFLNSLQLNPDQVAVPPRSWSITTYKPNSELEDFTYKLKTAHRILKIHNVPNNAVSLIVDMASRHLPAGVSLSLTEPDEELNEFRFVPDGDVKALQEAMYDLDNPRLKKRKKY